MVFDIEKSRKQWPGYNTGFNNVVRDLELAISTHNATLNSASKALVEKKFEKFNSPAETVKSLTVKSLLLEALRCRAIKNMGRAAKCYIQLEC